MTITYIVLDFFVWALLTFGFIEVFNEYKGDPMPLRIFKAAVAIPLGILAFAALAGAVILAAGVIGLLLQATVGP